MKNLQAVEHNSLNGDYAGKVFVFWVGTQSTKMQKFWIERLDTKDLFEE